MGYELGCLWISTWISRILNVLSLHQKSDTLLVSAFNVEEPLTTFCYAFAGTRVLVPPCRNECPVLLLSDHGELETGLN